MFNFRNIDNFIPHRFERIGMLKGKRWYIDKETRKQGLFKPQRNEHGDKKVFCANHYGEFIGHKLALNSGIKSCPAELARLSTYYSNIHKEINNGTPEQKNGCIIYSLLDKNEELNHGKTIIDLFYARHRELYNKILQNDKSKSEPANNIEIILAAIQETTKDFYEQENVPLKIVSEKVKNNKKAAIHMMVYDCLFGNNDRHDENWGMFTNYLNRELLLYPLYDNERVLGLYENQNDIETALENNNVASFSEKTLFSRMYVPGSKENCSNYKDVLEYLINNYPEETQIAIKSCLEKNTPRSINELLHSCEGLPDSYIQFGTRMYEDRYNYVYKLLKRKYLDSYSKNKINPISGSTPDAR